ncbi:GGDEF domain-containing protein [Sphingomonas sp. S2-65]|uniref:GGDEF domain-containing protein n=1 Tax=Sphingomonas sp. S2-65 TaxID=2903960 RepID=UPI001F3ABBED|nr:GGDEF domain-containing protein [Sphingomonas sp. S2-65]UYY57483.1 GGDEF domain-containing protein [Sphingomonas sp. S2-65]
MAAARAVRMTEEAGTASLFDRVGSFLRDHRLDPTPANYAFAYHLIASPKGPVARAVEALTESGVRISQSDVDAMNLDVQAQERPDAAKKADGLVARTQMQVEGFADMVTAMRVETEGFGRDLAASAAAMTLSTDLGKGEALAASQIARITATMIARVRTAEAQLETATREASELREKLEEARDNARRDPLTELPNRRAFEEAFTVQAAAGETLCIAVCDVDHFKSVNDRFGHAVGDRVLKAIGEALSQSCPGHLVARYGGEEFAILFSGVTVDAARALMETARTTVSTKRYRLRETDAPLGEITFSAGLTCAENTERLGTAFHRADRLLYAAKSAGRNRLRIG